MKSVSLRSIRAKYGCLKQTSVLTNAFAAISRVSSFASTFVWAHGILASSIHITSVIVSCAFLNFWKKSRRFINSHLLWLMATLLRAAYFLKWCSQLEFMKISWKEKGNYCELYKTMDTMLSSHVMTPFKNCRISSAACPVQFPWFKTNWNKVKNTRTLLVTALALACLETNFIVSWCCYATYSFGIQNECYMS